MVKVKFHGEVVTGETDLETAELICIPSKPKYQEVDLCLKENNNSPSLVVGIIKSRWLSFKESIKIGKEIERRWIGYKKVEAENEKLKKDIRTLELFKDLGPHEIKVPKDLSDDDLDKIFQVSDPDRRSIFRHIYRSFIKHFTPEGE